MALWVARDRPVGNDRGRYALFQGGPGFMEGIGWISDDAMQISAGQSPVKLKPRGGPRKVKLVLDE